MANDPSGKHLVWAEMPVTGKRIGIAYSTMKEAQSQAVSLKRDGYKILEIVPTTLPKPNA